MATVSEYGVDAVLSMWNGMFAITVRDCRHRRLHLIRDRVGIKPLYFQLSPQQLTFASELKSLRRIPGFRGAIDRHAVQQMMSVGYISGEFSRRSIWFFNAMS